ncbi:MAG: cupredoxin domain-containing protein [Candidatus Colwellbacteria bacterium]|nr:cupredoxin domain-containing protein [Candidatus Colwellbacteria bacterium]MDD3752881.1 cupredoxin domain-containing protein [Candidatus Colwellbacteria bacterium]
MDNKKILIVGGVIAGFLIFAIALIYLLNKPSVNPENAGLEAGEEQGFPTSETRSEAPTDIEVPELGDEVGDGSVAVPVGVTSAAPGVEAQLRTFNISAENSAFKPSTIIVNQGDTVHINFTAIDGIYDMTMPDYGLKQTANEGQTKVFEFQAASYGQYVFYCESCGGIDSDTKGYIIIKPRAEL